MDGGDLDLLRGTLDTLILKALAGSSRHGYDVARWIRDTTARELAVDDGALYTALHRMHRRGWLSAEWGLSDNNRKAKYYALTAAGRRQLAANVERWRRYARAVVRVLEAPA